MTMFVLAFSERMKMADEDQNDVATVTQKSEKTLMQCEKVNAWL